MIHVCNITLCVCTTKEALRGKNTYSFSHANINPSSCIDTAWHLTVHRALGLSVDFKLYLIFQYMASATQLRFGCYGNTKAQRVKELWRTYYFKPLTSPPYTGLTHYSSLCINTFGKCLKRTVIMQSRQTLSLTSIGIKRTMKTRRTTHALWLPSLGTNDNMLTYTSSTTNHHIYLHQVSIRRIEGEMTALMELQFCKVKCDLGRESSFADYRPLTVFEAEAAHLHAKLEGFTTVALAKQFDGPQHKFCFNIPLLKSNFIDRAISAAQILRGEVGGGSACWVSWLKVVQTTEVHFRDVWVPIGLHRLCIAKEISEEDLLERAIYA